jgi:DNA polymerase-3 subunit delta'
VRTIEPNPETEAEREQGKRKLPVIGVDQIRALADFLNMSSHRGRVKIAIVQPAEALNVNAANALLKSLEEPPEGCLFLLVSHRWHELAPTLVSRCQVVALRPPDGEVALQWLSAQGVPDPALALAYTGQAPIAALELSESDYWNDRAAFLRELTAREVDVFATAHALRDCPVPRVLEWLQKWSYDIACQASAGRVRYNVDHRDTLARVAGQVDRLAALRFHRHVVGLQRIALHPLNAQLFIENLLLGYRDLVEPQSIAA